MNRPHARPASRTKSALLAIVALAALLGIMGWLKSHISSPPQSPHGPTTAPLPEPALYARYGKSASCRSCHEAIYAQWEQSHHARAERPVTAALDQDAFVPPRRLPHGGQTSELRRTNQFFQIVTAGADGRVHPFIPERVLGVAPLRQYLVATTNGRYQASEVAYDPHRQEWFDVFGDEDRQPGEWGHWTGRGMNWNSMCAACHNTRVRRNYDVDTDGYRTTMAERGVSCEACHGPMADHLAWQTRHPQQSGDPTLRRLSRSQMFSTCAQCHSRRGELTGEFEPGADFYDHFQLTIPDETDAFYPDGQVHDEDYEFTAFLGSRMHAAGVRCTDCHEPHTSQLRRPGNQMCLSCHGQPSAQGAPSIDPQTHSFHQVTAMPAAEHQAAARIGSGTECVHCHMPVTTYMQRHPRHDHGFTIPDPGLTQELGIPNACNRCHENQSAAWAAAALARWYGPRTNRLERTRATTIARARANHPAAAPGLVTMLRAETNAFWQAVAANLLQSWADQPEVRQALLTGLQHTNALLRAMAGRGLAPLVPTGDSAVRDALQQRLADPVRWVRTEAAWALRRTLDTNSWAGRDLLTQLRFNADQPVGALQFGVFHLDRGEPRPALDYFRRAAGWDAHSAPLQQALGLALGAAGQAGAAVNALETACRLAPTNAEYRFQLALALNEHGQPAAARDALAETVKLNPQWARAWYNLGLADAAQNHLDAALTALWRAESLTPHAAEIPYARATVLVRMGREEEARAAAARALEISPEFAAARQLLRSLEH
ncbi:MAG TPA: multiheme c-type cytochrome [Verrucomicrobiota bacterium]|nr:multiheme c-type cytochrome [Verrucomicrobiota bacterium]HNT15463.1 multiheme c-type cytochrome [Verrucomicrobiota bacterium]